MNPQRDEAIARIVREHGPMTEAAITSYMETKTGEKIHGELLATSLRKLAARGTLARADNHWGIPGRMGIPAKIEAPKALATPAQVKVCNICGGTEFYPSGPCKNLKGHAAIRRGEPSAPAQQVPAPKAETNVNGAMRPQLIPEQADVAMGSVLSDPVIDGDETSLSAGLKKHFTPGPFDYVIGELEAKRDEINAAINVLRQLGGQDARSR